MIVMVGFMGAGKTSIGRLLARRLGVPFEDTDRVIEAEYGPIPDIFARCGEEGFRLIEADVVVRCLAGAAGSLPPAPEESEVGLGFAGECPSSLVAELPTVPAGPAIGVEDGPSSDEPSHWEFADVREEPGPAAGAMIARHRGVPGPPARRKPLPPPSAVVALGGGAVETPRVRDALVGHEVWWLRVSLANALLRVGGDPQRPVLADGDLRARFERRQAYYAQVATHTLDVGAGSMASVVSRILAIRE